MKSSCEHVSYEFDGFLDAQCMFPYVSPRSGYPLEALLLELQLLDSTTRVPGETLTGVEKRYRTQWIGALHAVMQNVRGSGTALPRVWSYKYVAFNGTRLTNLRGYCIVIGDSARIPTEIASSQLRTL